MDTTTDLITSFEAGLILRKSARTVQRMARTDENPDGSLPVVQKLPGPNGAYLFRRVDVEAYRDSIGLCPTCSVPTWHNGDPCPSEAVAS